ncbi:histidine kinase [Anopheles sinensis]|uniref:Histidine kinase n=1 Tax=Anopheles sinensis TaxID=74873 RepID=A0A084VMG7_ANOSI|nr:histidine kinase [Anopheles sinensis]
MPADRRKYSETPEAGCASRSEVSNHCSPTATTQPGGFSGAQHNRQLLFWVLNEPESWSDIGRRGGAQQRNQSALHGLNVYGLFCWFKLHCPTEPKREIKYGCAKDTNLARFISQLRPKSHCAARKQAHSNPFLILQRTEQAAVSLNTCFAMNETGTNAGLKCCTIVGSLIVPQMIDHNLIDIW